MKYAIKIIVSIFLFSSISFGAEYVVISNKNMKDLSKEQVKAVFLKKISFINDTKIVPINLGTRDSLRMKFEKRVLKMNFSRLKTYWTKQHYLGKRPPLSMKSQESIKAFVKKVDGAIGYIDVNKLDENVKEIYRWSE